MELAVWRASTSVECLLHRSSVALSEIALVSTRSRVIDGTREAIDAIKSCKMLASGDDYNGFMQGRGDYLRALSTLAGLIG